MKVSWKSVLGFVLLLAAPAWAIDRAALQTDKQKASYSIGVTLGKPMASHRAALDPDVVARGLRDGFSGARATMTDPEMTQFTVDHRTAKSRNAEGAFLAANKDKVSYVTGLGIGRGMRAQKANVDPDMVAAGLRDGIMATTTAMTDDEMRRSMDAFQGKPPSGGAK